ncbi:response regulator [Candidatus Falkowbacteria bacterium]|nr:response regulator [Candidatus Falkowbacteria bacterium]
MSSKKTILLVEDDRDLLSLMNKKLKQENFNVLQAETGQQALDILAKQKPDLVLLDILLPDIDGLTVLNEIASKEETEDLPVIILSNLADQGSLEQAQAVGDYEYLVKAKTELNEVVKKIREKTG